MHVFDAAEFKAFVSMRRGGFSVDDVVALHEEESLKKVAKDIDGIMAILQEGLEKREKDSEETKRVIQSCQEALCLNETLIEASKNLGKILEKIKAQRDVFFARFQAVGSKKYGNSCEPHYVAPGALDRLREGARRFGQRGHK